MCKCRMHAAHPSVREKGRGPGRGRYEHWSEWALGGMVGVESGVRSTLGKGEEGGEEVVGGMG